MPIALTCDCGARFEIDESRAGRDLPCPDCGVSVRTPARGAVSPRISWLALVAASLLLMGAFSATSSAAASLTALASLWAIRASKGMAGGQRLALGVAIAGAVLAVVNVVLLMRPNWVPVGNWLRRQSFAGQLDPSGPLEVTASDAVCSLTRPSREWARSPRGRVVDPAVGDSQKARDIVLVQLGERAYVDAFRLEGKAGHTFGEVYTLIEADMLPEKEADEVDVPRFGSRKLSLKPHVDLLAPDEGVPEVDGRQGRQWTVMLLRGGLKWKFLIRAYKKPRPAATDPIHVIRAYAPASSFDRLLPDLRAVLDSVRFAG